MTRTDKTSPSSKKLKGAFALERVILPIEEVEPDPRNRQVLEDEDFQSLVDSVRVLGLLQPVHVRVKEDGRYQLIDGERRWRAARRAGLVQIPCDVWPGDVDPTEAALAGFALNEQRKAPGCVHVARRLRDMKNELGFTHEELAAHAGLPLDRVKTYFGLFGASDHLISFFESHDIALKVAVEFVRYEKSTNEGHSRRLVGRYLDSPLTAHELAALRKRNEPGRTPKKKEESGPGAVSATDRLLRQLDAYLERGANGTFPELETIFGRHGYRLVSLSGEK
jgi:ParB family chromosome partitioning protein